MSKKKIEFVILGWGWRVTLLPGNPITVCEIREDWDGGVLLAYGLGVRKPTDPYDKETGCRMALQAALRKPLRPGCPPMAEQYIIAADAIRAKYLEVFPIEKRPTQDQILIRWFKNMLDQVTRWQLAGKSPVEYPWPPMSLIDRGALATKIAESAQIKKARVKRQRRAQRERKEQR